VTDIPVRHPAASASAGVRPLIPGSWPLILRPERDRWHVPAFALPEGVAHGSDTAIATRRLLNAIALIARPHVNDAHPTTFTHGISSPISAYFLQPSGVPTTFISVQTKDDAGSERLCHTMVSRAFAGACSMTRPTRSASVLAPFTHSS
jgi:hypothetical protein